ncbi:DUF6268 family outer membrane beta-barrel protein [Foetidibacter luteolus]|uniref:DUF6268 family outer membrane beta-barrel protein n=1 Tax=Foetidibacter luteolus TaxID=2608880 RepID=UPI00129A8359|nr:DUF6268 family outer membrane beta-barrel protein [Foetidibacter luteolus]
MKIKAMALCMLPCIAVKAQDKDLVAVTYNIASVKHNDTSATVRQFDAKFRLPVVQRGTNVVTAAVNYKNLALCNFPETFPGSLQAVSVQLFWVAKFAGNKSITVFANTGVYSDMRNVSGNDYRYAIGVRYRVHHSPRLSTGWGLAYAKQFFGNQLVPFIDVSYQPNDKWSLTGQFPIKPKLLYHFSKKLSAGIEMSGEGSSYRLGSKYDNRYMQLNQWTAHTKLEYLFAGRWQLNLAVGANLRQTYKLYSDASSVSWTIITIPLGNKDEPLQKIEGRGFNAQVGISFGL